MERRKRMAASALIIALLGVGVFCPVHQWEMEQIVVTNGVHTTTTTEASGSLWNPPTAQAGAVMRFRWSELVRALLVGGIIGTICVRMKSRLHAAKVSEPAA